MKKNAKWQGSVMLLLAAMIWGCAFVAQSVAMEHVGPFTFASLRFLMGAAVLLPVIALFPQTDPVRQAPQNRRGLWIGGVVCGGILFLASSAQQIGLIYTTVGKSGFITALYVVLVPITGWVLFRRRVSVLLLGSVLIAVLGLYFLCGESGWPLNKGDFLTLVCALLYTAHILFVDHFVARVNGVKLACLQFLVSGILGGIVALFLEWPISWEAVRASWLPLCYTGILSSGVAYTFQILGQRRTAPAVASLLMSLESVFAVLAGVVILQQRPTPRETVGCVLMFVAVLAAQVSPKDKRTASL